MKLYHLKIPFLQDLFRLSSYKVLINAYTINKRITKIYKNLSIPYLELDPRDLLNRENNAIVAYLFDIETLKLETACLAEFKFYANAEKRINLDRMRCKTLYTGRLLSVVDYSLSYQYMDLPKGLERLYYLHSFHVTFKCPTLVYLNIRNLRATISCINILECGKKLEIDSDFNILNIVVCEKDVYPKVDIIRLENFEDGLQNRYKWLKELHVKDSFYKACEHADKYKLFLYFNDDAIIQLINYVNKLKTLPKVPVTLIEESGIRKEFKTCEECLEYLCYSIVASG